jgi:hypothetical protein
VGRQTVGRVVWQADSYRCHTNASRLEYLWFLICRHVGGRPAWYGASKRFATMPS